MGRELGGGVNLSGDAVELGDGDTEEPKVTGGGVAVV